MGTRTLNFWRALPAAIVGSGAGVLPSKLERPACSGGTVKPTAGVRQCSDTNRRQEQLATKARDYAGNFPCLPPEMTHAPSVRTTATRGTPKLVGLAPYLLSRKYSAAWLRASRVPVPHMPPRVMQ